MPKIDQVFSRDAILRLQYAWRATAVLILGALASAVFAALAIDAGWRWLATLLIVVGFACVGLSVIEFFRVGAAVDRLLDWAVEETKEGDEE